MQFSSIWPIVKTLSGATPSGKSGSGSDGTEGALRIPPKLQHYWNLTHQIV